MRGSIVKKGDKWYVVVEDRDQQTGQRKRRWHSGYRTKREAQSACNDLLAAIQHGEYVPPSRQTVAYGLNDSPPLHVQTGIEQHFREQR